MIKSLYRNVLITGYDPTIATSQHILNLTPKGGRHNLRFQWPGVVCIDYISWQA